MDIKIIGLVRPAAPLETRAGDTIVAYFDAKIEWLDLRGGALVRRNSGGYTVWEPRLDTDGRRRMKLSPEVRRELVESVLPVFEQFGGEPTAVAAE